MPSLSLPIPFEDRRHKPILDALEARRQFSLRYMRRYEKKWRDAEDQFVAYQPESDADRDRRQDREQKGTPRLTTIKVPHSYAQLMAAHTYWTSVFLGRSPIFQHQGRHGEAAVNVEAVDALIDYQVQVGGHLVPHYTWLLDPGRYGFGVLWNYWADETEYVSSIEETAEPDGLGGLGPTQRRRIIQEVKGYSGNRVFNVEPWDVLPDPRVSLSNFQQGEFFGRRVRIPWSEVRRRAAKGIYFNVETLERLIKERSSTGTGNAFAEDSAAAEGSPRIERPAMDNPEQASGGIKEVGYVNGYELVVTLIPKEWQIGKSEFPEKWVFTVGENQVVIGAAPLGALHNKYPAAILEYEPEGYGLVGRSLLERAQPLNNVLDWLLNTHFYNVRAALANQFIYDPSRIYEQDVLDPAGGKFMRLRPEAYGADVRTILQQIPVQDVTRSNIQDLQVVSEIMQRITGINDTLMGALDPGGRKTATEVRSSSSFGINRLKTAAEYFSASGYQPLDMMLVQNTQQYYDQEKKFRIAGDRIHTGEPFVDVSPATIQGFFDFVPVDGTMPVDKVAMANLWRQLLMDMARIPQIAAGYRLGGIFEFVAQMAGLRGIKQFRTEVLPDAELARLAAQGNVVPLSGQPSQRSPEAIETGAPEPSRLPDIGRTQ